jgi:hypothetical protein
VIELAVNMGQFMYFYIIIWKKGKERRYGDKEGGREIK